MIRAGAVAADLVVGDAESEQAVGAVRERRRDLGGRGAGEIRLDEDDVRPAAGPRAEPGGVERAGPSRRTPTVASRSATAAATPGRASARRRRTSGAAARAAAHDDAARPPPTGDRVHLLREPHVDVAVARRGAPRRSRSTSSGWPGTWIVQPGSAREQRHVGRGLVRPARAGAVVRRARADEHRADALVDEIQLDLLERPLDEKRRVRVDDRTQPSSASPAATPIISCSRMPTLNRRGCGRSSPAPISARTTATRGSSSSELRGHVVEALPHRRHGRDLRDDDVRPVAPAGPRTPASSASWSRPSTRTALQPSSSNRRSIPPGQP